MTIILCITLWLLSGFLAAWIYHKYVHEEYYHTSIEIVSLMTVTGLIALMVVLAELIDKSDFRHTIIFYAKEKK